MPSCGTCSYSTPETSSRIVPSRKQPELPYSNLVPGSNCRSPLTIPWTRIPAPRSELAGSSGKPGMSVKIGNARSLRRQSADGIAFPGFRPIVRETLYKVSIEPGFPSFVSCKTSLAVNCLVIDPISNFVCQSFATSHSCFARSHARAEITRLRRATSTLLLSFPAK